MKGLILKDLYMSVKYCRFYLAISVAFTAFSVLGNNIFFLLYPVLMCATIPVSLISYDEKSRWNVYAGVLPYSKKDIVSVKYVGTLIFLGIGILLIGISQAAKMMIYGTFDWKLLGIFITVIPITGLVGPCLMFPAIFKFGAEKGRAVFYGVIILVCALYGALGTIVNNPGTAVYVVAKRAWVIPVILVSGLLLLWMSWRLSVHFYQKREL